MLGRWPMGLNRLVALLAVVILFGAACTSSSGSGVDVFDAPSGSLVRVDGSLGVSAISRVVVGSPANAWVAERTVDQHVHVRGRLWSFDSGVDYEFEFVDFNGAPALVAATMTHSGMGYEGQPLVERIESVDFTVETWNRDLISGEFRVNGNTRQFWVPIDGNPPRLPEKVRHRIRLGETVVGRSIPFRYLTLVSVESACAACQELSVTISATRGEHQETFTVDLVDGVGRLPWRNHEGSPLCLVADAAAVVVDRCDSRPPGTIEHIALAASPELAGVWNLVEVRADGGGQVGTDVWRPRVVIGSDGGWSGDDGCNVFTITTDRSDGVSSVVYRAGFPCDGMETASGLVMDVLLNAESAETVNGVLIVTSPVGTLVYDGLEPGRAAIPGPDVFEVLLPLEALGSLAGFVGDDVSFENTAACPQLWTSKWVAPVVEDGSILAAPGEYWLTPANFERAVILDSIDDARSAVARALDIVATCNTYPSFDEGPNIGGFEFVPLDITTSADVTVSFRLIKNPVPDGIPRDGQPPTIRGPATDFVVAAVGNVVVMVASVQTGAGAVTAEFVDLSRAAVEHAADSPVVCSAPPDRYRVRRPEVIESDGSVVFDILRVVDGIAEIELLNVGWNVDESAVAVIISGDAEQVAFGRSQLESGTPWIAEGDGWVTGIFGISPLNGTSIGALLAAFGDSWLDVARCAPR